MSTLEGPGEGTWAVFAEKVVRERDEALDQVAEQREAYRLLAIMGDKVRSERDIALAEVARLREQLQIASRDGDKYVYRSPEVKVLEFELRSLRSKFDAEKLLRKRDQERIEELKNENCITEVKKLTTLVLELQETCKVLRFLKFDVDGVLLVHLRPE